MHKEGESPRGDDSNDILEAGKRAAGVLTDLANLRDKPQIWDGERGTITHRYTTEARVKRGVWHQGD